MTAAARPGAGPPVLERVPGQDQAMAFLRQAASRPHHAYLLAGPEGGGKQLAARAFAAALLCPDGGCGECRACKLALAERHPNVFVVEPAGWNRHTTLPSVDGGELGEGVGLCAELGPGDGGPDGPGPPVVPGVVWIVTPVTLNCVSGL